MNSSSLNLSKSTVMYRTTLSQIFQIKIYSWVESQRMCKLRCCVEVYIYTYVCNVFTISTNAYTPRHYIDATTEEKKEYFSQN